MCFETTKSARAKIADKDIECWKFLDYGYRPPFAGVSHGLYEPYKKGIINSKVKIKKVRVTDKYYIYEGYHSFKSEYECTKEHTKHFYWECYTHKFIIPKGTRYYENDEQYVSETIILQ